MNKYLKTRTAVYEVEQNDLGYLKITKAGVPIENPGLFISVCGGVNKIIERLIDKEELDSLLDLELQHEQTLRKAKEDRIKAAQEILLKSNPNVDELLFALRVLVKSGRYGAVDIVFNGNNNLVEKLLELGEGSFTVNMYEDEVIITFYNALRNRKYSTHRFSKLKNVGSLEKLLKGEEDVKS